ncbi:MAG: hypothetical protein FWD95_10785, partial [Nocardioidaceae bacterium]|nr:hypothetical protein [Nocardioidaceae bacterium]
SPSLLSDWSPAAGEEDPTAKGLDKLDHLGQGATARQPAAAPDRKPPVSVAAVGPQLRGG